MLYEEGRKRKGGHKRGRKRESWHTIKTLIGGSSSK